MVTYQFFHVFWVQRLNSFYKMNTDQFVCLKKIITRNVHFASTRKGIMWYIQGLPVPKRMW